MPRTEELAPVSANDWSRERALHLLNRAGFGGTPGDVDALAAMTPEAAVEHMLTGAPGASPLPAFEESGFWEPSFADFPPSRPAATEAAEREGAALGVKVKPGGNRPLQPVTNRFFYWLRATKLETRRLAFWWMERMLTSPHPLEEKMTLFWHGHFATSEEKLRDYRKIHQQLETLRAGALGSFRDLLEAVSKDPAMLVFLDATHNVKGAPNENFGREVMELFTMGVGNYTEDDIREAARAFTGWTNDDLAFAFDEALHDDGEKRFLGQRGRFNGDDILRIILQQEQTAIYIASKIYRFFVREEIAPAFAQRLGALLRDGDYEIRPFLRRLFLSEDFYAEPSVATHIHSPTELIITTYRKLGLSELPGVPDPSSVGETLGQVLLVPPTVAGWSEGRAWITPGLLFERGNFAKDVMFPDMISFRDPNLNPGGEVRRVNRNLNEGMEITGATLEEGAAPSSADGIRETFNTRYASVMGWQEAMRKLKPIPRRPAQFSLTEMVEAAGATTAEEAVDALCARFLPIPLDGAARAALVEMLEEELGTSDLAEAEGYMEFGLRLVAHGIMCAPQYQLA
ncbi:DUF1800 domain-containing protein [Pseudoroseicyclus tamaricis]|uniref:DUF1800 domain-containing protein n=1 Tax=Pseudoroseicyclus tamaricis TaxID=2705421 RepID=A0A6B2JPQ1_9RHOB|nr:DUF1800 domain-containing protein [Pseudoroseicyclus tamaricis]NDV00078.1 DUF1800 domain-containing protein [Pseudoroseicyclus tamaricis]